MTRLQQPILNLPLKDNLTIVLEISGWGVRLTRFKGKLKDYEKKALEL